MAQLCARLWRLADELSELSGRPPSFHYATIVSMHNGHAAVTGQPHLGEPCGTCGPCKQHRA